MRSILKLTRPAPLSEPIKSRQGNTYMFRAMKFMGWIPPESGILRYVYMLWSCATFGSATFYLPVAFVISYVREYNNFTASGFLTSFQVCINVYGTSVKTIITFLSLWRLTETEQILDQLDESIQDDLDRKEIHRTVARCNYGFLIYSFIYCSFVSSTVLSYVLSGRPPWSIYFPFVNWHDGAASLWLQSLLEYITISFVVMKAQLADTYPMMFVTIFRAHYNVLKDHVRQLRTDANKTEKENYRCLVNCINDHKLILRGCELLRPMISRTIFVQFLLIGSVLGLALINAFFFSNFWRGVAALFFVLTILMQTFPFCYTCNLLIEDSDDLTNTIFQSNWIDAERGYKSTLIHFMHHVQQPIIFIAGGIFPISMSSNISVAKFAFSIITIARQMIFR